MADGQLGGRAASMGTIHRCGCLSKSSDVCFAGIHVRPLGKVKKSLTPAMAEGGRSCVRYLGVSGDPEP